MANIAIITARGGSKRIPGKNIREFSDKPIMVYSIESALSSNLFDEVMVSTDNEEIAKIAEAHGAQVPFFRSAKNSDDHATTFDVLEEVLNSYAKRNKTFEYGCCLYPTSPFTRSSLLKRSFDKLVEERLDVVFPAIKYSYPIQRALKIDAHGRATMVEPEHLNTRTQDLEMRYHDAGQFYWFKTSKLLETKSLWTENTGIIEIDEMECQDIDNEIDWEIAELKYKLVKRRE